MQRMDERKKLETHGHYEEQLIVATLNAKKARVAFVNSEVKSKRDENKKKYSVAVERLEKLIYGAPKNMSFSFLNDMSEENLILDELGEYARYFYNGEFLLLHILPELSYQNFEKSLSYCVSLENNTSVVPLVYLSISVLIIMLQNKSLHYNDQTPNEIKTLFDTLRDTYNNIFKKFKHYRASVENHLPKPLLVLIAKEFIIIELKAKILQDYKYIDNDVLERTITQILMTHLHFSPSLKLRNKVLFAERDTEKKSYDIISKLSVRRYIDNQPFSNLSIWSDKKVLNAMQTRVLNCMNELRQEKSIPSFFNQQQRKNCTLFIAQTDGSVHHIKEAIKSSLLKK